MTEFMEYAANTKPPQSEFVDLDVACLKTDTLPKELMEDDGDLVELMTAVPGMPPLHITPNPELDGVSPVLRRHNNPKPAVETYRVSADISRPTTASDN